MTRKELNVPKKNTYRVVVYANGKIWKTLTGLTKSRAHYEAQQRALVKGRTCIIIECVCTAIHEYAYSED